jgi:hypothetical protein
MGVTPITNPDGHNYQWSVIINGQIYWPIAVSNQSSNGHPKGVLIGEGGLFDLDKVHQYVNRFHGLGSQLYHPNEIYAHLVAKYMVHNITYPHNSTQLYQLINRFYSK